MSCKVNYKNGLIQSVKNIKDNESKLFSQIASLPYIDSLETALEIYKQTYNQNYEVEPNLSFSGFDSLEAALQSDLKDIEVQIPTNKGIETIYTIPNSKNQETKVGFINSMIAGGFLNSTKKLYKGKSYLVPKGDSSAHQKVNMFNLELDGKATFGIENFQKEGGMFNITDNKLKPEESLTELEVKTIKDIAKELTRSIKTQIKSKVKPNRISEQELKVKLLNILSNLGISTLSISEYVKKYNHKKQVDPKVEALADISNRVVAIKEGSESLANLTEETLHFIVEALPQEEIQPLLDQIDQTEEYLEFADVYRDIYESQYPVDEVENIVRKEVLAKVMKNSLLGKVGNDLNFMQQVLQKIKDFFNSLLGTEKVIPELTTINRLIEDIFIENNLDSLSTRNLNSNFVLYSITNEPSGNRELDKTRAIMKSTLNQLKLGYASIQNSGGSLASDAAELRNYENIMDSVEVASTVADFVGYANRQVSYVANSLAKAEREKTSLSIEELNTYNNLRGSLADLLASQKTETERLEPSMLGFVNPDTAQADKQQLITEIEQVNKDITDLKGRFKLLETDSFENIIERIQEENEGTLPEGYIDTLKGNTNNMTKDIGFFMSTFGQMIHASDPMLNIAATLMSDTRFKETIRTQKAFRAFTKVLEDNDVSPEQLQELINDGYIVDNIDHKQVEIAREQINLQAYNFTTGETLELDEYLGKKKASNLTQFTPEQSYTYLAEKQRLDEAIKEKPMNEQYYTAQQEKYEKLGVTQNTIQWLRALSIERSNVQNEARQEDGTVVYDEIQKNKLKAVSQRRKIKKSFYNSLGGLKKGITKQNVNRALIDNLTASKTLFVERGGLIYLLENNPSEEAQIAFDLSLIDQNYTNDLENQNKDLTLFVDKMFEIEQKNGYGSSLDFVKNNLGISLSSEFWEAVTREPVLDNEYLNSIPENKDIIEDIKEYSVRRSEIKKLYQDTQNPSEIEGNEMRQNVKEQVKDLTNKIEDLKSLLKGMDTLTSVQSQLDGERQPNRAYFRELNNLGVKELSQNEIDFIQDNMSRKAEYSFLLSLKTADKLDNKELVSDNQAKRLEEFKQEGETYRDAAIRYGRTRLLPYYQRFTPEGYETLDDVLDENSSDLENMQNIANFINKTQANSNYELNIHYTFRPEENEGQTNPLFNKNYEGGYFQPKLSEFKSTKYQNLFKPNSEGLPTDNLPLWEAREALLELQRENLKDIGEYKSHNLFLLPQISATGLEKTTKLIKDSDKTRTLKEIIRDTFKYNIDDKEYGEENNKINIQKATDARTIPKFYLRNLEEESDVSQDIYYSYLMFTKQSKLYKARLEGISDIMAVEDKMLSRNYAEDKTAQSTNNYKMLKNYIDYNFYGKREVTQYKYELPLLGEVDFTKFFRVLAKYVRIRNLGGLNIVTPFTSLITGEVQVQIEATLGEYMDRDSLRAGSKEFGKLAGDATKQSLEYNDKSKINVLGEWLNIYEMNAKAANAQYGTMVRTVPKLGFIAHQAGNFPIIPRIFLASLHDYRLVDGRILNKQQFLKTRQKVTKTPKAQLQAEWSSYDNEVMYNYLNISETGVEYKPELIKKVEGDVKYLDNKFNSIRKNINQTSQFIDTQISESNRTAAQRNALFSFITMHRSFLSIGLTRRFKDTHLNLDSGMYEKGSYITLKDTIIDVFGNFGKGESKSLNFIKALSDAYNKPSNKDGIETIEAKELRQRNLKRIGVEFGFMAGLVVLGTILKAFADDPDNEDLYTLQLSNYMMFRLMNETASSQGAIVKEVGSIIKAPVIGYDQILNAVQFWNGFDTEEINKGTYKGLTKAQKYWIKSLPGTSSYYDLFNPRTKGKTYQFYNKDNTSWASMGLYGLLNE